MTDYTVRVQRGKTLQGQPDEDYTMELRIPGEVSFAYADGSWVTVAISETKRGCHLCGNVEIHDTCKSCRRPMCVQHTNHVQMSGGRIENWCVECDNIATSLESAPET